ncbi:Triple functional domain protein, partial [Manis javanica]
MLFAAGMGIGLMFYGVSEPLQHFLPPTAVPSTPAARAGAAVHLLPLGSCLGRLRDHGPGAGVLRRYNLPLTMRSGLYPLLGKRINGPPRPQRGCLR